MPDIPELKPCPFCRKAPAFEQGYSNGRKPLRTWAVCKTPGCAIEGLEILAEKWNTRADSVERLREALRGTALRELHPDDHLPCWCDWAKMVSPDKHTAACLAVRAALTDPDSSQGEEK